MRSQIVKTLFSKTYLTDTTRNLMSPFHRCEKSVKKSTTLLSGELSCYFLAVRVLGGNHGMLAGGNGENVRKGHSQGSGHPGELGAASWGSITEDPWSLQAHRARSNGGTWGEWLWL